MTFSFHDELRPEKKISPGAGRGLCFFLKNATDTN